MELKIRDNTMDVLLRMGMPAGMKGTVYICDAMELFDTDPYYQDGKICSLYADIARRHEATASRVERAIRHAFESALKKGKQEVVLHYLDVENTQNSNLLRGLYFRMYQEQKRNQQSISCDTHNCELKKQIYQEVMDEFFKDLEKVLAKRMEVMDVGMEVAMRG